MRLKYFVGGWALALVLGTLTTKTFAVVPTVFETFENDVDEWTPTDTDPYNDETLDGLPPGYLTDIRSGNIEAAVTEEVPSGFFGVNSPDGSGHIGLMQYGDQGTAGYPIPGSTTYPNRYSFRVDIWADPTLTDPIFKNNGLPEIWWTNSFTDGSGPFSGYESEKGLQVYVNEEPGIWRFHEGGSSAHVDLPAGQWYTMEVIYENDASPSGAGLLNKFANDGSYGHLQAVVKVWNINHSGKPLFVAVEPTMFQEPPGGFSLDPSLPISHPNQTGGPGYTWFAHPPAGINHIFIDNIGISRAIGFADLNGDGDVNNLDIQPFEKSLTLPEGTLENAAGLDDYISRGDINMDGEFNNLDIQPFEKYLTGQLLAPVAGAAVPEPSSLILLGLGALAMFGVYRRRSA